MHVKNRVIMSLKKKLFQEMFKNVLSSNFSNFSTFALLNLTQPNPPKTEKSRPDPTQPMGQPNPWSTLVYPPEDGHPSGY